MAIKIDSYSAIGTIGIDTETFAASNAFEMIYGLAGNDVMTSAWNGLFVLGSGNDSLTATGSTDETGLFAYGAEGSDTMLGAGGADWLWGGSGNDSLVGGTGGDRLYGDAGDFWLVYCEFPWAALVSGVDTLSGGDGDDLLLGGELADQISGGAGSDLFVWENANEFGDAISGFEAGAGGDVLFFPNLIVPNGATPDLGAYFSFAPSGADTLVHLDRDGAGGAFTPQLVATLKNVAVTALAVDQVAGFTSAPLYLPQAFMSVGSEWADTVTRTIDMMGEDESVFTPLYTLAGDDVIGAEFGGTYILGDGNDSFTFVSSGVPAEGGFDPSTLFGGAAVDGGHGSDTLTGAGAADRFSGGSGDDSLTGGGGDDELFGDCGDQRVIFTSYQDVVSGVAGIDTINGGEGTDLIVGGGAADQLTGGAGSDLFVWERPDEFGDTITDFQSGAGGDRLLFNNLIVPQAGLNWSHYVRLQQAGADTLVYLDRDATGTAYPEQWVVTLKNVSVSTLDASQLPGLTPGVHVLAPRPVAMTSEWADTLDLGVAMSGDPSAYYLLGGDDVVTSGRSGQFSLGDGNDRFTAGTSATLGSLYLEGDAGNDTLNGGAGADDLTGGSGSDLLAGGGGDDEIQGDCGDSELTFCDDFADMMGAAPLAGGVDTIDGGAGSDVIIGGAGADDLTGGTGSDLFVYDALEDFGDLIRDFEAGASGDRILFNGLIQLVPGASAAAYISLTQSGSDTLVWLDRDATGPLQPQVAATLKNVNLASIVQATQLLIGEEARVQASLENNAPTASDAAIPATEDTVASGTLPPASDLDGDPVTYAKASDPGHGALTIAANGGYTYTPAANYSGSDSFTYAVSDGRGGSSTYTVSVTVNPVNDAPTLLAPAALNLIDTASNDVYLLEFNGTLQGSDLDLNTALAYGIQGGTVAGGTATRSGTFGSLQVNVATGAYTFFPNGPALQGVSANASESFTVTVSDGSLSATAPYTVNIAGANDVPTLQTQIGDQNAAQGAAFLFQVPQNSFADRDTADVLSYSAALASGQPLPAWLTFNPGTRTFSGTPGPADPGNLNIRVTATDAASASVHDDFTLTIAPQTVPGTPGDDTLQLPLGSGTVNAGTGIDTVILPMFPNVFTLAESSPGQVSGSYAGYSLSLNDVEFVQFGRPPSAEDPERFQSTLPLSELVSGAAQEQLGRLTDLYLAFFGRAPDVSGLEYWQEKLLEEGRDFATISKDFAWSTEAQALYPVGGSNREFVRTVYLNCFARQPDAGGWDYWTGRLDGLGVTDLNDRGAFVGEVILGAYASSSGPEDRALLTHRHEAAMYYVNKLAVAPAEGFDAAINTLLTRVTGDAATEDKAEAVIDYAFANPVTLTGVMTDQALLDSIWGA